MRRRGTSQSIIQRFLIEVDPAFASEQYAAFRRQFIGRPLGLVGIREYPLGVEGGGDVDSGPLILGISASATVVSIGAAQVHGDEALARPLLQVSEAFGLPLEWGQRKRYALGALPVGDAFIAWSKTAMPWTKDSVDDTDYGPIARRGWRLPAHGASLAVIALLWLPAWGGRRRRRASTGTPTAAGESSQ